MIIALGAFDGFHRGHAFLFERARSAARDMNKDWGVVTFEPHPGIFIGTIKKTLFSRKELFLISKLLDVPNLITLEFTERLRSFSALEFWQNLNRIIKVDGVVVGKDFRFGLKQQGDFKTLETFCEDEGLFFEAVDLLKYNGKKISSTTIREHIERGNCPQAAYELGYPWFFYGNVISGNGRGKKLGFPTANLKVSNDRILPPNGVYSVILSIDGEWKCGALSIGRNPTFNDVKELRIEVYILDFQGDLYGKTLPVFFLEHIRQEVQFESADDLTAQLVRDVNRCRAICNQWPQFF